MECAHTDSAAFVAPTAVVCGDVVLGEDSSVWHNAVIRADLAPVRIGKRTNIQDGAVLHVSFDHGVNIGDDVTVGHGAIVHGCTVQDGSLIGMGAIILDGASIGTNCIIGAGALVTQGTTIASGSVAYGSPARVVRAVTSDDLRSMRKGAEEYVRLAQQAAKDATH